MNEPDPPPPNVDVMLTLNRVVCSLHREPFVVDFPKGYIQFMLYAFDEFTKMESFPEKKEDIDSVLDEKPLCCRLSKATLLETYEEAGKEFNKKRCQFCQRFKVLGSRFRVIEPETNRTRTYQHICFRCVVYCTEKAGGSNKN